jgi:hypothetical protein
MIALVVGAALAQSPNPEGVPTDAPAKDLRKCDKLDERRRATAVLADVAEQVRVDPVSSTSFEFNDRLKRVRKAANGYLCTYGDFLNAATALSVSGKSKDLDKAFRWAAVAAGGALPNAPVVATHSFDRALVSRGLPQHYGTQYGVLNGQPRACMYPIDPTVTDAQRAEWGVAPIADTIAAFLAEKGHRGKPPTEQTLRRVNLLCLLEKW